MKVIVYGKVWCVFRDVWKSLGKLWFFVYCVCVLWMLGGVIFCSGIWLLFVWIRVFWILWDLVIDFV